MIDFTDFIKDEQYGTTLENNTTDLEFYYLNEALNSMSLKLQYQFEKIYLEELALKDANIMALQSQINPHFLNNTLEIINWEARMMKNYKVSGMIESLSTMLEATMNRSGKQLISLAEEMSYVDAYLFIISQRFGEKFEVEKNIEDDLTTCEVPRLIIQPIIENAVEHGMDITTKGKVVISIFRKDDYLVIEIMDNGHMTDEEIERVEYLLSDQYEEEKTGTTRLGIRNVNERLKIMYGEKSGLTIKSNKEGFTVSIILVKCNK